MTGFLPLRLRGRPTSMPAYEFGQGMGVTDLTGRVINFPLQVNGIQIWVDGVNGDDTLYNGYSPYPGERLNGTLNNGTASNTYQAGATGSGGTLTGYGPKKTLNAALALMPSNARATSTGNQLFAAKGSTYAATNVTNTNGQHSGRADFPYCFQSYDSTDPMNVLKRGRINGPNDYATISYDATYAAYLNNIQGAGINNGGVVVRGFNFISATEGSIGGQTISFSWYQPNMLFESNIFNDIALELSNSTTPPNNLALINPNTIVRQNVFYNEWGNAGAGVHSQTTNLTVEDNVFLHCGWRVGADRNDSKASGGANNGFNHAEYIAGQRGTWLNSRRNLFVDSASFGTSDRGAAVVQYNVHVDDPGASVTGGTVGDASVENPAGVYVNQRNILILGSNNVTTPFGRGVQAGNCLSGSTISYVYALNNPNYPSGPAVVTLQKESYIDPVIDVSNVLAYAFSTTMFSINAGVTQTGSGNVNSVSSPATNSQIFQAAGWADKAAIYADLLSYPRLGVAYRILQAAGPLLGLNMNVGVEAPLPTFTVLHYTTGTESIGNLLTCVDPILDASSSIVSRQWYRIRPSVNATAYTTAPIAGATGATYTPQAADTGYRIGCAIWATNGQKTNVGVSAATAVMA